MTPAIELTSVPAWAVAPIRAGADLSGRYWTVVVFGGGGPESEAATEIVAGWLEQIATRRPGSSPRVHLVSEDSAAENAVTSDLATARVGWRLMIAGPADACLRLRARADGRGVGDDEMVVATTSVIHRSVHCAHCGSVTRAAIELGGVLPCDGCGRDLVVHQHVSRRIGAHLGAMASADDAASEVSS